MILLLLVMCNYYIYYNVIRRVPDAAGVVGGRILRLPALDASAGVMINADITLLIDRVLAEILNLHSLVDTQR